MELPENNDSSAYSRWEGLKTRVLSGVAMAAIAMLGLLQGGWLFTLLILVAAMLMINEWNNLTGGREKLFWRIAGLLYVAIPCASIIWLRGVRSAADPHVGMRLVLYVLLVVCATDIGAFFAGRKIGGPKLAPRISPGKTWAGLAGGVVAAAVIGVISPLFTPYPPSFIAGMDLAIVVSIVAQAGDLFESWLKRRAGAKDSGNLIPGHGGLLDRVDGLIFTTPLFAVLVSMSGSIL